MRRSRSSFFAQIDVVKKLLKQSTVKKTINSKDKNGYAAGAVRVCEPR